MGLAAHVQRLLTSKTTSAPELFEFVEDLTQIVVASAKRKLEQMADLELSLPVTRTA